MAAYILRMRLVIAFGLYKFFFFCITGTTLRPSPSLTAGIQLQDTIEVAVPITSTWGQRNTD